MQIPVLTQIQLEIRTKLISLWRENERLICNLSSTNGIMRKFDCTSAVRPTSYLCLARDYRTLWEEAPLTGRNYIATCGYHRQHSRRDLALNASADKCTR